MSKAIFIDDLYIKLKKLDSSKRYKRSFNIQYGDIKMWQPSSMYWRY